MHITRLSLDHFRNYKKLSLTLDSGVNIFYGDNAQGKTNILESIYLCGTGRSHRTNYDKELIQWEKEESHIQLYLLKDEREERIDFHLRKNDKKAVAINGISIQKLGQLLGILNVVIFSPEDLGLIKSGPRERRRFIDIELCQLDPVYFYNLQQYNKILKQRNNLLKEIMYKPSMKETLFPWDQQLVEYGAKLIQTREEFVKSLNEKTKVIHEHITAGKEHLIISYEKDIGIEQFEAKLKKSLDRDIRQGNTSVGPHRDDILFMIDDIDIRTYGSQGQQRTTALSIKMAEIEIIKETIQEYPVLLLDDVLSELDETRQLYLLDYIKNVQTILTCTGIEDSITKKIHTGAVFKVDQGTVKKV